jgi:hypothetical protein
MPVLTKLFPKIQFIVATHSPFVLNSLSNAVIYDLEKHIRIEESLQGVSYEGIVESYFEQSEYSNEIVTKLKRYEELILKDKITEKEDDELFELRLFLKDNTRTPWLSPALSLDFNRLERLRKGKNGVFHKRKKVVDTFFIFLTLFFIF